MSDEFYIGYQAKTPPSLGKWISRVSLSLIAVAAVISVLVIRTQDSFYQSTFECGIIRSYEGIYSDQPGHSIVVRDENNPDHPTTFLLVSEGKFGFNRTSRAASSALQSGVKILLNGTLIRRDEVRMLEVVAGSLRQAPDTTTDVWIPPTEYVGKRRVTGEIVDSKCFLGVMNPGDKTVHRACARLCIRGGIPPMLHLDSAIEGASYILITGEDGESINEQVLPFVASPVEITGELFRTGDLYELRVAAGSVTLLD